MALPLIFIGIVIVVAGARDTYMQLGAQLYSDMGGFLPWVGAMLLCGIIGYWAPWRTFSMALMALIIVSVLVSQGGQKFFGNLQAAFTGGAQPPQGKEPAMPTEIPIMATSKLVLEAPKKDPVTVKIIQDQGGGMGGAGGLTS